MINVGILGAGSPHSGELIRILINHPDVMLRQLVEPSMAGRDVTSVHHGLIGECSLEFTAELNPDKLDVLFIADPDNHIMSPAERRKHEKHELKVINLVNDFRQVRAVDDLAVFAVPEVNRKALVRGAMHAVVPSPLETITSVALYPLAMKSMLPAELDIVVESDGQLDPDLENVEWLLGLSGNEPRPHLHLKHEAAPMGRVVRITTELDLDLPLDNITDLYEELYDDHNLTHIVAETVDTKEVEGTDKCIITLDKTPEGRLMIQAVADARLRGGAGDAVHTMNLMTGLYEKTGLALKASNF